MGGPAENFEQAICQKRWSQSPICPIMIGMSFKGFKEKVLHVLRIVLLVFRLQTLILYIAFLSFMMANGFGNHIANLVLLLLSIAYGIFLVVTTIVVPATKANKVGKRVYRYSKLLVNAVALGINIYGLVVSTGSASALSIFLVALSLFSFLFKVGLEILVMIVERKVRRTLRSRNREPIDDEG